MVYGFSPYGARGEVVRVEVDVRRGLPGMDIVGLPSSEVRESRDRVRVAIRNSGFEYPAERILVSMSPAEIPKTGAGFDLPVALALLERTGQIRLPDPVLAVGELSIRGGCIAVRGTFSAVLGARERGIPSVIVPGKSLKALAGVRRVTGMLLVVEDLRKLRTHGLRRVAPADRYEKPGGVATSMDDISGQPTMKNAAAVCAAGFHNLLLMGPPGSGKTMTARRLTTLMPILSKNVALEVARIHSMRGMETARVFDEPPIRIPHHGASLEGMLGGGRYCLPGEVSLAHRGTLVLDEATEFRPQVLQALREPVENRSVAISRAGRIEQFPAAFQLVLTSNLCPCGQLGRERGRCMCSMQEIARYWRRVGAALLDRIDVRVRTSYSGSEKRAPSHGELSRRVASAVERQERRFADAPWNRNGLVPAEGADRYLPLSRDLQRLLLAAMKKTGLSDRAAASVRAVSRTIADLADRDATFAEDILEAAALRSAGADRLVGREPV